jgi:hypothetical protein
MAGEDERPENAEGFVSAAELARRDPKPSTELVPAEAYVVSQVMDKGQAFRLWNGFLELKRELLLDPNCFDTIGDSKEMNRTGATRLATAFGLSLEIVKVDEAVLVDERRGIGDVRFQVRVRASRGPRYADGIASCRISEIPKESGDLSKREHFALTRASTRATKRAIADILGGTEAE